LEFIEQSFCRVRVVARKRLQEYPIAALISERSRLSVADEANLSDKAAADFMKLARA
jgi:hypothetical protein